MDFMIHFVLGYICLTANLICLLPCFFWSRLLPSGYLWIKSSNHCHWRPNYIYSPLSFNQLTLQFLQIILYLLDIFILQLKCFIYPSRASSFPCRATFLLSLSLSLNTACSLNSRSTVLSFPFLFPSTPNHHVPVPALNLSFNPPLSVAGSLTFTPSPSPSAPCARPSYPALPTTTLSNPTQHIFGKDLRQALPLFVLRYLFSFN